jgi:hypothetical protein
MQEAQGGFSVSGSFGGTADFAESADEEMRGFDVCDQQAPYIARGPYFNVTARTAAQLASRQRLLAPTFMSG